MQSLRRNHIAAMVEMILDLKLMENIMRGIIIMRVIIVQAQVMVGNIITSK